MRTKHRVLFEPAFTICDGSPPPPPPPHQTHTARHPIPPHFPPAQKDREQVLFVMSNAARRLGELLYPTGSLPAGLSINTTLMGLQGPVTGAAPPPPPKPSAAAAALAWVAGAIKAVVFYALGGAGLYYAASILRAAPPTVTLEFGLGCVALCWALPTLKAMLTQQPTSTA